MNIKLLVVLFTLTTQAAQAPKALPKHRKFDASLGAAGLVCSGIRPELPRQLNISRAIEMDYKLLRQRLLKLAERDRLAVPERRVRRTTFKS